MPSVLITGANRGLGLEFARQYSADGWDVIATARDLGDTDELQGLGVRVEQLDAGDLDAVTGFARRLDPPLDLLIANAGTWIPEHADTAEDGRAWAEMFVVNSIAPYLLGKSLLRQVAAAARGKLIAITSKMGSISDSSGGCVAYRSSKAALNMAWHALAIEARPLGITAAVLNPGWVRTRMGGPSAPMLPKESIANMRRTIERLTPDQSGGFFNHDGSAIAW
jgi:NAD(P)-dependent dehydrogenase (short-subunit alcohol dehydrogenase family)